MATVRVYRPNGVLLPEPLLKRFSKKISETPWDPPYAPKTCGRRQALFHDVFYSRDHRYIHAIDAAWHREVVMSWNEPTQNNRRLNKKVDWQAINDVLLPIRFYCQDQLLPHRSQKLPSYRRRTHIYRNGICLHTLELPEPLRGKDGLEIEARWGDAVSAKLRIQLNPFAQAEPSAFVLHTLQKDEPLEWIEDWMLYHHRVHGVERVVLYDNGSQNFDALHERLAAIEDPIDITLIPWDYDYFSIFSNTQWAALNHCAKLCADAGEYYINLDIDEYLVNPTKQPLKRYLDARKTRKRWAYFAKGRTVPNHIDGNKASKRIPRASDFGHVNRHLYDLPKTINIYGRFEFIDPHQTYPINPDAEKANQPGAKDMVRRKNANFHLSIREVVVLLICKTLMLPQKLFKFVPYRAFELLPNKLFEFWPLKDHLRENLLTYNHYYGLNRGWKQSARTKQASAFYKKDAMPDRLTPALFQKHRIGADRK